MMLSEQNIARIEAAVTTPDPGTDTKQVEVHLQCCYVLPTHPSVHIRCERRAEWGILSADVGPYDETHACPLHLVDLLEDGVSQVWPMQREVAP